MNSILLKSIKENKHQYRILNKKHPKLCNSILYYNRNNDNISWSEKTYLFLNIGIKNMCECGNKTKFINVIEGYRKYCSLSCSSNSKEVKEKTKQTNLKNLGVEYIGQSNLIKEKIKQTNLKNLGVEYPAQNKEVYGKVKQTNLKKYGVDHHLKLKSQQEKQKQTNLERYGVEYVIQNEEIKEKIKQTNLERYGVPYAIQNKEILKRANKTKKNKTINNFIIGLNLNIGDIEYKDNLLIIKNCCEKHPEGFEISYNNLYNRLKYNLKLSSLCTICNPVSYYSSSNEINIRNWLEELNIKTKKIIILKKEIDIYLPDYKLGIEFNGLYWHSDLYKDKNYHLNKTELCLSKGIQLLHIFEDEWIYKSNIVKSIIKAKLGLIENKIFGRKCIIKEITSKESRKFLNENHIQGNVNSSIRIGLFYKNELVSLMTFGKKRKAMGLKSKEGEYEMYRFCNKLNTSVIGGASKLFKYFFNTYKPKEVISYADRRYFDGSLYEKLGFEFIKSTKPNFYYFKKHELIRYHRFNFRKDVLVKEGYDPAKTAEQIMIENGYLRIYDSGNLKYRYT